MGRIADRLRQLNAAYMAHGEAFQRDASALLDDIAAERERAEAWLEQLDAEEGLS